MKMKNADGAKSSQRKTPKSPFDVEKIRHDFPLLGMKIHGRSLVYLDNAATTQKPQPVIESLRAYYSSQNANIHRGIYHLSEVATEAFEEARVKVQRFLNAKEAREIIFVRGATEGINLVAHSYGRTCVRHPDEVVISALEHHSNIVPWQILCEETGATLRVVPINEAGEILFEEFERLLGPRTKLVSMAHVSNAIGTINPVKEIIAKAHELGIPVLVDGAQAAAHLKVDVRDLDADFYVFSGHKVFGPTGVGVVYGRSELLEAMPPYQGGGDMISAVSFEKTQYNRIPYKFEAGTPHIEGVIGLGSAIDYVLNVGLDNIENYESGLLTYADQALSEIPRLRMIGTARKKASIISFVLEGVHAHDVGTILDEEGIAIRAGHHCAMPLMERFGVPATARASFAFYNTRQEIDALANAIRKVLRIFK